MHDQDHDNASDPGASRAEHSDVRGVAKVTESGALGDDRDRRVDRCYS